MPESSSPRALLNRIRDHNQKSRNTSVYSHISKCESFSQIFTETYGIPPKFEKCRIESLRRLTLLKDRFSIIASNLDNYYQRTDFEGLYITLNKPVLNEQVKHTNVKIIWYCGHLIQAIRCPQSSLQLISSFFVLWNKNFDSLLYHWRWRKLKYMILINYKLWI